MKELVWTRGFCTNPLCGRYIRHFGESRGCPQCGMAHPNQAVEGLTATGMDYWMGRMLGMLTCTRYSFNRLIERALGVLRVRPRNAEELGHVMLIGCELLIMFAIAIRFRSYPGWVLAIIMCIGAMRVIEVVAVRLRVILYDRRISYWRHGTFTRTFFVLCLSMVEVTVIFGIIYSAMFDHFVSQFDPLIYSGAAFFAQGVGYIQESSGLLKSTPILESVRIAQFISSFFLVVCSFAALVNMMAEGREADPAHLRASVPIGK